MHKNKFLLVAFLVSLASVIWLFGDFVKAAVVAWLLVLVTQRFAEYLEKYFAASRWSIIERGKLILTAGLLTLLLSITVIAPLGYLVSYAISRFDYQLIIGIKPHVLSSLNSLTWVSSATRLKLTSGVSNYLAEMSAGEHLKQLWGFANGYLKNITGGVFDLGLVIVFFFLFHWNRHGITSFITGLIPLDAAQKRTMANDISGTLSIVFMTIFAVAVAQGLAFALLMMFFDYNPLLLGFFAAISSVIPIFGTALVWVPVAINEAVNGHVLNAIVITLYSWLILAFLIDNFVRIFFLNKISRMVKVSYKVNEFLLFFSIAAGIATLGFWGVLIGPALIALFIALAKALQSK